MFEKTPVKSKIPSIRRKIPAIISIFLKCFLIPEKKTKKRLIKSPDIIKGTASPSE